MASAQPDTVSYTCHVDAGKAAQLRDILSRIVASGVDLKELDAKLDAMGIRDPSSIRLGEEQKKALVTALSPYKGQQVIIKRIAGDAAGEKTAEDFLDAFKRSGWTGREGGPITIETFQTDTAGIGVEINEGDSLLNRTQAAASALIRALLPIVPQTAGGVQGYRNGSVPHGMVQLTVGKRP